jgi:AraC-like DNA-binding protein
LIFLGDDIAVNKMEYIALGPDHCTFTFKKQTIGAFPGYYHYHRGLEFYYVHQGKGQVLLNQRIYELKPGRLFIYRPYQLHKLHVESNESQPYTRSIILFEPAVFELYVKPYPRLHQLFLSLWKEEQELQVYELETFTDMLTSIMDQYAQRLRGTKDGDKAPTFALLLLQLLETIHPLWRQGTALMKPKPRTLKHSETIMEWVEERYAEEIGLEWIAGKLHLSKHHVSRLFRKETGSSITEYIAYRRIRQACSLLGSTSLSVQTIGQRVGLHNTSYFCQLFRRMMGVSPQRFRKDVDPWHE